MNKEKINEKHEIGVMTKKEIKDLGFYGKGLDFWTNEEISKTRIEAKKYCKKVLKENPDLYKKGKGVD